MVVKQSFEEIISQRSDVNIIVEKESTISGLAFVLMCSEVHKS